MRTVRASGLCGTVIAIILYALPAMCSAGDYAALYRLGRKAAVEGYPRTALFYLSQALAKNAVEGGKHWVPTYGHNREPYLPHFFLGLAFYQGHRYQEALEHWLISERQGAVQLSSYWPQLQSLRARIQTEVRPAILNAAGETLVAVDSTLHAYEASATDLSAVHLLTPEIRRDAERLAGVADSLHLQLEAISRSPSELRAAEELAAKITDCLRETEELLRRTQARVTSLSSEDKESVVGEVTREVESEACNPAAFNRVYILLALANEHPDLLSVDKSQSLRVATLRQLMWCGYLGTATEWLGELRLRFGNSQEIQVLQDQLSTRTSSFPRVPIQDLEYRETTLEAYVESAVTLESGECDHGAIGRMNEIAEAVRYRPDRRKVARWLAELAGVPYTPQLHLALGYRNCGDAENSQRHLKSAKDRFEEWTTQEQELARAVDDWVAGERAKGYYGGSDALVILERSYGSWGDSWPDVHISKSAELHFQAVLRSVGFDNVEILTDLRKEQIEAAVDRFSRRIREASGKRRRALVYLAGHGVRLEMCIDGKTIPSGYFVPVNAPAEPRALSEQKRFIESSVGMDEIERWARELTAHHAVFILDSCFSGTIFDEFSNGYGPMIYQSPKEAIELPVRLFVTSSNGSTATPDLDSFLNALSESIAIDEPRLPLEDRILTGEQMCLSLEYLTARATGVHSACGKMFVEERQSGDVLFYARNVAKKASPASVSPVTLRNDIAQWKTAKSKEAGEAYREYLQHFPEGRFSGAARLRLCRMSTDCPLSREVTVPPGHL